MGNLTERLRGYRRMEGPKGSGRDKANLGYWAERASENSRLAPRAKGGEIRLPDTGGPVKLPDTGGGESTIKPRAGTATGIARIEQAEAMAMAKRDRNHVGTGFQAKVRRTTE